MTERERLIEKLMKTKALAERGVGGERENAERILAAMLQKYGISLDDLESEEETTHWLTFKTDLERRLLHQLAYKYCGSGHAYGCVGKYTNRPRKKVGIDCTNAIYIEIEADFDMYRRALEEDLEIFYSAFIAKNNIYPPPELAGDLDDDGDVDYERQMKVAAMAKGIERRTRNKALPSGG